MVTYCDVYMIVELWTANTKTSFVVEEGSRRRIFCLSSFFVYLSVYCIVGRYASRILGVPALRAHNYRSGAPSGAHGRSMLTCLLWENPCSCVHACRRVCMRASVGASYMDFPGDAPVPDSTANAHGVQQICSLGRGNHDANLHLCTVGGRT